MKMLSIRYRILITLLITVATVSFHYGWIIKPGPDNAGLFHAIHGRLCYIPIILGAIWFGIRGGLFVALLVIALTLPYAIFGHVHDRSEILSEYTEMVFYLAIGLAAGVLIELQRRERNRSEALAKELARQSHLSSLGQMAAGLAHEIKNPLGSIKGSAEMLIDDFPANSRKHELLKVLTKETNRLNRVVEDFLTFARPQPLQRRLVQVNQLLDDVISQLRLDARTGRIEIVRDFDTDLPEGFFDPEKLHQVFLNISLNAVAAMPNGGTLRIETRCRAINGEAHAVVSFSDNGSGINPEHFEKIFDPFFTTKEEGTGLGLSISHMIVQHHGGHVDVDNKPGPGARISVTLPLRRDDRS